MIRLRGKQATRQRITKTEAIILKLVWEGLSSREIAAQLGRSVRTIHAHRANIAARLNTQNTVQMIRRAIAKGILSVK